MAGKRLPDSELELMMIIWDAEGSVTRSEIENRLPTERKLSATTVLSFLSRLQEKGFLEVERDGKTNRYLPLVEKETISGRRAAVFGNGSTRIPWGTL